MTRKVSAKVVLDMPAKPSGINCAIFRHITMFPGIVKRSLSANRWRVSAPVAMYIATQKLHPETVVDWSEERLYSPAPWHPARRHSAMPGSATS